MTSRGLMYNLLTAPTNISLIAENAIQSGLSRTATIQRQIELSEQTREAKGLNSWLAAGVTFQKSHIDGFTEQGTTGITALSFNSQTRDSQVTQLGWRGSMKLGAWKPFVEATWNHEWNDDSRTVTTTLISVVAPSYNSLPTPVASDWGNAILGVSYKISPNINIQVAFSKVFANSESPRSASRPYISISA